MNKLEKCAFTPTHVICPDVDGLPEYLTAGKRYEVEDAFGPCFRISADNGQWCCVRIERDMAYLNGADWIPVYADDEGPKPAQPNWEDLGPRMLEALREIIMAADDADIPCAQLIPSLSAPARRLIKEAEEQT